MVFRQVCHLARRGSRLEQHACDDDAAAEYGRLVERTLQGGSNEEILEWCFNTGRRRDEEEIMIWNAFLSKAAGGTMRARI